jgi:hypothetical protein
MHKADRVVVFPVGVGAHDFPTAIALRIVTKLVCIVQMRVLPLLIEMHRLGSEFDRHVELNGTGLRPPKFLYGLLEEAPAQGSFGGVVGETDATVVEEAGERRPAVEPVIRASAEVFLDLLRGQSKLKEHQAGPRTLSCELILQGRRIVACPHYPAFMAFL